MIASALAVAGCLVALALLARRGEAQLERLWGALLAKPSAFAALMSRLASLERAREFTRSRIRELHAAGERRRATEMDAASRAHERRTAAERRELARLRSLGRTGTG
jgi:hypothetical protein